MIKIRNQLKKKIIGRFNIKAKIRETKSLVIIFLEWALTTLISKSKIDNVKMTESHYYTFSTELITGELEGTLNSRGKNQKYGVKNRFNYKKERSVIFTLSRKL